MRVRQLLKITYTALPELLLHLKILNKLPLLTKNPPSTQPLERHSPQCHSPPHGHSSKSPPHTTSPQNPLTE
jgi:hypothetical protein